MLDKWEKSKGIKEQHQCGRDAHKPELSRMMAQLSDSQRYVVKYWGRQLKVAYLIN